jgi:hypothetical protein
MPETKTYNGWTNYETWNVALWLGNEEHSSRYWDSVAQECYDEAEAERSFTKEERATLTLADKLRDEIRDGEDVPDLGASMYSDLLNAALSEVSWMEIARHYMDEVDKTEDPEDDDEEGDDDE